MKLKSLYRSAQAPIIAIAIALAVSALALLVGGYNPGRAFSAMASKVGSVESAALIVNKAVPIFLSGLAVSIGFRMGIFNIGVEGQYLLGAALGGVVGAAVDLPGPIHVLIIMLTAMFFSMLWALIPAVLNVQKNVHIVISTIMLNAIAVSVIAALSKTHWFITTAFRQTRPLKPSAFFPNLNTPLRWIGIHLPKGTQLFGFVIVAILVGVGYHILMGRTRFGFDIMATGINPTAARFAGVNPKRTILVAMALSGAIGGLIGMAGLLEDQHAYRVGEFPVGFGFAGIAVALLGRGNVSGLALSALLFGLLERASLGLSNAKVPREFSAIMVGLLILTMVIIYELTTRKVQAQAIKEASELLAKTHAEKVLA